MRIFLKLAVKMLMGITRGQRGAVASTKIEIVDPDIIDLTTDVIDLTGDDI